MTSNPKESPIQRTAAYSAGFGYDDSSETCITNVHHAFSKCSANLLSNFLTSFEAGKNDVAEDACFVSTRKTQAILDLIASIEPNPESSADEVILPWNAHAICSLNGVSWPNVLGRRILIPSTMSQDRFNSLMALVLFSMVSM